MNANPFNTSRVVFRTIGKCIYCQSSDVPLKEEHIIPYGLNGNFIVQDASCAKCEAITSAFERDILRNTFMLPRKALNLRSRRKKKRKDGVAATLKANDSLFSIQIPPDECPVLFVLPEFLPPAILDNRNYEYGIQGTGLYQISFSDIDKEKTKSKYGSGSISFKVNYQPVNFAKMLAKIAYSLSVAVFGLENIEDIGILSSIKGETDDIGKWVGTAPDKLFQPNMDLHNLKLDLNWSLDMNSNELQADKLICRVGLFSYFNIPEYVVVVGNINKELVRQMLPFGNEK